MSTGLAPALDLLLAMLATWRLSFMLTQETGPWDMFTALRRVAGESMLGHALQCFYCTSVWVAAPLAVLVTPWSLRTPVTWLALSGGACLLHRATDRGLEVMPLPPRDSDGPV